MLKNQCSNCQSYKTQKMPRNDIFGALSVFFAGGGFLMLLVGIVFWPLLIVAIPMIIIGSIIYSGVELISPDKNPRFKCKSCGYINYASSPLRAKDKDSQS